MYRTDISPVPGSQTLRAPVPSGAVTFRPEAIRGAAAGRPGGHVDYRLARNHVVNEFRRGRLSRLDVCDAHPELIRAARSIGVPKVDVCPICESEALVQVTYAFGNRLPPSGKTVATERELAKLRKAAAELAIYVVEACVECSWNHLDRSFSVGGRQRRA